MAVTRPPNIKLEPQATLAGETPQFLAALYALARAFPNLIFDIFSGYRTDAYSQQHGGFAGDPHTRGVAADINVGGRPLGYTLSPAQLARFGFQSGNVPNFYQGKPDPAHIQLRAGDQLGAPASGLSGWLAQFVLGLARATGLRADVIAAWVKTEGGPSTNPLNIGPGRNYGSTQGALAATAKLINTAPQYAGIRASARSDANAQLRAIVASPWDAGHYGGHGQNLFRVYGTPFIGDLTPQGDPLQGADQATAGIVGGITSAVVAFIKKLLDPHFWIRVLEMLAGGVLVLAGLYLLAQRVGLGFPRTDLGPAQSYNPDRVAEAFAE